MLLTFDDAEYRAFWACVTVTFIVAATAIFSGFAAADAATATADAAAAAAQVVATCVFRVVAVAVVFFPLFVILLFVIPLFVVAVAFTLPGAVAAPIGPGISESATHRLHAAPRRDKLGEIRDERRQLG
jgi:hypothetical protein